MFIWSSDSAFVVWVLLAFVVGLGFVWVFRLRVLLGVDLGDGFMCYWSLL